MTERLVAGLKNQQLIALQEEFGLSGIAFVIQCSNLLAAVLLQRNSSSTIPAYRELETIDIIDEEGRETPCIDSNPTAWLFPRWKPQKVIYIFGTLASRCDILLPLEKFISRRHFAIYLSHTGVWIMRNLSRYGTWVNGDLLGLPGSGQPTTETTLNPDSANEIRVGNFEFSLHPVPHVPMAYHNDVAISLLLELEALSESRRTTSATVSASAIYHPSNIRTEAYHYLHERSFVVQGDLEVCAAIQKSSGQYCIAKIYATRKAMDKAEAQYEMMLNFKDHSHVVSYNEWLLTEAGARIITPHLDAVPLYEFLEPQGRIHDIEMAFLIYKQMAGALECLKECGVVHNDINESTILVELQNGRYTSYLTGFSEYSMTDATADDPFRGDLSNLTSTVEKMLPAINDLPCCDPELRTLMLRTHKGQISATELCAALDTFAPGFERNYFQSSLVTRDMNIVRVVDGNGTEAVRLLDFLRIILHQSPKYLKEVELAIKKVIRKEHFFQLCRNNEEKETYCSLHDAEKLLHHRRPPEQYVLGNHLLLFSLHREEHTRLLDLTPPTHTEACFYETTHTVNLLVSYHEPTGTVNLTQILNLFETEIVHNVLGQSDTSSFRELRGSPQWDGYYTHQSALPEILSRLSLPTKHYSWNDNTQCRPINQFFGGENIVSIASDEMIGIILFNRQDEMITWGDRTLTTEDGIQDCEDHGLPVARDALIRITSDPSGLDSALFYRDGDIMKLFDHSDEPDFPTEAASQESFQSQDTIHFRPKKKKQKGNSDIPTLPVERKISAKEKITPVKKVEEWVVAGPDIRPTTFTSSKKGGDGSRRR